MEHEVTLKQTIVAADGWAHCERTIRLPFVPWVGLSIDGRRLKALQWDAEAARFAAWLEAGCDKSRPLAKCLRDTLGPGYESVWAITRYGKKDEARPAAPAAALPSAAAPADPGRAAEEALAENAWLDGTDPRPLLKLVQDRATARKLRLFAVACCRSIWQRFDDPRSRHAVEVAERFADGQATARELAEAFGDCPAGNTEGYVGDVTDAADHAALYAAHPTAPAAELAFYAAANAVAARWGAAEQDAERAVQARLLRCLFGNPFQPITLDPSWLTPPVLALAQAIYDERRFADLPALATALEAAGCQDLELLLHARAGREHARGCWVLDLLLGNP